MLGFFWWLIIGLLAGLLARMLMPGKQSMGLLLTMVLGLVGSILGGLVSSAIFGTDPRDPGFQASGLIMSTVGALIVLGVWIAFNRRKSPG